MNAVSDEKPKRQTLTPYSARLTSDQVAFLKTLPNASEWLRKAIDEARVRDSATSTGNRVILLAQQIRALEGQIAALEANSILTHAREELEKLRTIRKERERRLEALQVFVAHPENWSVTERTKLAGRMDEPVRTEPAYSMSVPTAVPRLAPDEVEAASRDELTRKALEKAQYNLSTLMVEREGLAEEEAKQAAIIHGFEEETRALEAKRRGLEDELLQAGSAAEAPAVSAAQKQDGSS